MILEKDMTSSIPSIMATEDFRSSRFKNKTYLVVIIPCFNEEKTIGKVVSSIPASIPGIDKMDILVIDDGSSDKSVSEAKKYGAKVISHSQNIGVGKAFQTGIQQALNMGADLVVNMDGDGQFNAEDIPKLLEPIIKDHADFVTASRFKDIRLVPKMPWIKKWGNRRMSNLISMLSGRKFFDVSCGFRAYSYESLLHLNLLGKFTYTQETFLDLAYKGLKIIEVPIKVRGEREFGKSKVAGNIFYYAFNSAKIIFRTLRDYKPLKFFGAISAILLFISMCLGGFFLIHYWQTGKFSGHLWAGFSSGFLLLFSFLFFVTGLLADMFDRIRINQERILYLEKKRAQNARKE
jgi:glycosyltransferase involved in cell wall biosynthesis